MTEIRKGLIERSINHPANRELRNGVIHTFLEGVPRDARDILNSYPEDTRRTVERFKRHVVKSYKPEDHNLILSALDLSIVAHERNGIVKNRTRKDTVTPYIQHPVEIAGAVAGLDRKIPLTLRDQEKTKVKLPVRQHPYKAEVVVAALLHDVLEDVYLPLSGDRRVGIGRKQRDIHWPEVIGSHLKAAGGTPDQIRRVNTMVQAVTKYYQHDFDTSVREGIMTSSLFQTFIDAVSSRGSSKSPVVIEREVVRTLSDLHRMFAVCFPKGEEAMPQINDGTMEDFFGALAIKLHDIENNLETGVRTDKIIRAHLLAHFARFFGLPIASRLGIHLIVNNEYDITSIGAGFNNEAMNMVMEYCAEESDPTLRPKISTGPFTITPEATQIPITTYAELQERKGPRKNAPMLQYKCTVDDSVFAYLGQVSSKAVRIGDRKGFTLERVNSSIQDLIREYGRQVEYYLIERVTGTNSVGIVRFQDAQPNAHSVIALGSGISASKVPEHRLLEAFDGTSMSTMEILAKMSPLRLD